MNRKNISAILFWGAAWGIVEASLGYLLHLIDFTMGWMLWFPIAFYFLNKCFKKTGKPISMIYVSFIAASIKLVDLLLPCRLDKVLNPTFSILIEGVIVYGVVRLLQREKGELSYNIVNIIAISLVWRGAYALYTLFLPEWMASIAPTRAMEPFLKFLFLEGIANGLFIYFTSILSRKVGKEIKLFHGTDYKLQYSMNLLFFAFVLQWLI